MKQPYKVVILCGGLGTRMQAYAQHMPKSLVPIGGRPIIWHVMKLYSRYGFRDFVLTLGYKGDAIIDYFRHYHARNCDFTMTFNGAAESRFHTTLPDDEREWSISFVHTGLHTMTGGRVLRVAPYIAEEHFLATYTDGLSDVNIRNLLDQHLRTGVKATMLSVNIPTTFGMVEAENGIAIRFREKPLALERINGGFFVFHRSIFDRIKEDATVLEEEPLQSLVEEGQLGVYQHDGFWACMDTPKDVLHLDSVWNSGNAPWKTWIE
jgi:glucose-1-phosphate cytidylyltransferase